MSGNTLRLVLDVLKPHEPSMMEYARQIEDLDGVEGVNTTLIEIDEEVQNIKIITEGEGIDFEQIKEVVEDLSGSIHSIDQIACGERLIEEVHTPQD